VDHFPFVDGQPSQARRKRHVLHRRSPSLRFLPSLPIIIVILYEGGQNPCRI
jgi:hypothetical protein